MPDELASNLKEAAHTDGQSVDDVVIQAVRRFLSDRDRINADTVEGLRAIRRGEVLDHQEVRSDFDNWGG